MTEDSQEAIGLGTRFSDEYRKHYSKIYSQLMRKTGNKTVAEDLTQETFRKAFESLNTFREGASFGTWLYGIAHNVALDYFRDRRMQSAFYNGAMEGLRQKDGHHRSSDEKSQRWFLGGLEQVLAVVSSTPEQDAITCEEVAEARKYIMTALSEKLRHAYSLHLQGYTDREIAEQLGMKEQAVTTRISRARQQLRNYHQEQSA